MILLLGNSHDPTVGRRWTLLVPIKKHGLANQQSRIGSCFQDSKSEPETKAAIKNKKTFGIQ